MPGFNPEKVNIHDLVIEDPEEIKGPFDPEKDLREYPVSRVQEELYNLSFREEWNKYAATACNARLLYPDGENLFIPDPRVFESLAFDLTETQYELETEIGRRGLANQALMVCLLGGRSRIADLLEKLEGKIYNAMGKAYDDMENDFETAQELLVNYKLLYPTHSLPPMKKVMEQVDKDIEKCRKEKDESNLVKSLFFKKLFNSTLSPKDSEIIPFDYMRKEIQGPESVSEFLGTAGEFACLSAEKIIVDEDGIHLSFAPKVESGEPTPSMPEVKNF